MRNLLRGEGLRELRLRERLEDEVKDLERERDLERELDLESDPLNERDRDDEPEPDGERTRPAFAIYPLSLNYKP